MIITEAIVRHSVRAIGAKIIEKSIESGDMYVTWFDGPQLYICKEVRDGYVIPVEFGVDRHVSKCYAVE